MVLLHLKLGRHWVSCIAQPAGGNLWRLPAQFFVSVELVERCRFESSGFMMLMPHREPERPI